MQRPERRLDAMCPRVQRSGNGNPQCQTSVPHARQWIARESILTPTSQAITPVWATETASHTSRGAFVSIEFTLNIFGVVVAYWIEYGTSFYGNKLSSFIWRFPIAFQIVPLLGLLAVIWFMPESPRWLVKVGREKEARFILGRLRGEDSDLAEREFQDIRNIAQLERDTAEQNSYFAMFFGIKQGKLHTARRVQLVIWLQILQEWIGIAGITIYGVTEALLCRLRAALETYADPSLLAHHLRPCRNWPSRPPMGRRAQRHHLHAGHSHLRLHPRPYWTQMDAILGRGFGITLLL